MKNLGDAGKVGHEPSGNGEAVLRYADGIDQRLSDNPVTSIDKRPKIHRKNGCLPERFGSVTEENTRNRERQKGFFEHRFYPIRYSRAAAKLGLSMNRFRVP